MWTESLYRLQYGKNIAVDFSKYQKKRILIANVNHTYERAIHHYCEYLLSLTEQFHKIFLLITKEDKWQATSISTYYPTSDVILDRDNMFFKKMASTYKNGHDLEKLFKKWNFQIVIENNQIQQFYDIPVDNRFKFVKEQLKHGDLKTLLKEHGNGTLFYLQKIFQLDETSLLESSRPKAILKPIFCKLFLYPGLWPNKNIELLKK